MSGRHLLIRLPDLKPKLITHVMGEIYDWGLLDLNIPQVHKKTMGENIKVGIVDSGKSEHFETIERTKAAENFSSSEYVQDKCGHSCLHPDGLVFTSRNGLEKIREFYDGVNKPEISLDLGTRSKYVGDMNIKCLSYSRETQKFELDKITYVHKIPVQDEILNISFNKNSSVKLTRDHPTYAMRELHKVEIIESQNLKIGDYLLYNSELMTLSDEYITINYGLFRECQYCGHKVTIIKEHCGRKQCKKCNKAQFVDKSYSKILDMEWAYLVGLIIADGHLHYDRSYFIQISNNDDNIIEYSKQIFKRNGYRTKIYYRKEQPKQKTLTICSKELCEFFMSVGIQPGKKTKTQTLPKFIQQSPLDIILAFLGGLIDGDGSIAENGRVRISSGSLDFCKELTYFLFSIGIRTRYIKASESGIRKIKNKDVYFSDAWHIIMQNPHWIFKYIASSKKNKLKKNGANHRKKRTEIKKIESELFDGYFYDFSTEKNHNYQGNGVVISNTFIAGIIAAEKNNQGVIGVAPKAELYFAKAMGDSGKGDPAGMVRSIRWLIEQKVDIISISAGLFFNFVPLHTIIKRAYKKNITVVGAVGNTAGRNYDVAYPARYAEVIGVAAYNSKHKVAKFSSRGVNVTCAMPGVDIFSTYLDNQYITSSGTSYACPLLTGICALILSRHRQLNKPKTPCKTPKQMMQHLKKYSVKLGDKKATGFGTLDVESMMKAGG